MKAFIMCYLNVISKCIFKAQEDLFSFEERSGRQSTMSWSAWSGHSRDLIADELHYMREEAGRGGAVTPSSADPGDFRPYLMEDSESGYQTPGTDGMYTPGLMTPGGELDVEMRSLMRMESRPLADDVYTPGTSCVSSVEQYPLHPLHPARLYSKLARRALVSIQTIENFYWTLQTVARLVVTMATAFCYRKSLFIFHFLTFSALYVTTTKNFFLNSCNHGNGSGWLLVMVACDNGCRSRSCYFNAVII